MTQARTHRRPEKVEKESEVDQTSVETDLAKTDELLDCIGDVLEDQEKLEFKEKLRRWAQNQRRLSPKVEMYERSQYKLFEKALEMGENGDCPCCGWPLSGPPGPECIVRSMD